MRCGSLLVVGLLVLAGCSSGTAPSPTEAGHSSPTPSTPTPTSTPERTPTSYPTPTPDPYPENYWDEQELVVAIETTPNVSRVPDYEGMVREATAYWNGHSEQYAGYPMTFRVEPNASSPDIIVEFTPEIKECGIDPNPELLMGCAAEIREGHPPERPEVVTVESIYASDTTVDTIRHELGHLLGISHGEEPMPLMNASGSYLYRSLPNITDREYPWEKRDLTVYVDEPTLEDTYTDESRVKEQIRNAIGYFQKGEAGVKPDDVTLAFTENQSAADIVITFEEESRDNEAGSLGQGYGIDADTDQWLEYRTQYVITVTGLDEDAVGWHVGYWTAFALGVDEAENLPRVFQDASARDRRSSWWR